jgi:hydroxyacylglutathione hydrolase
MIEIVAIDTPSLGDRGYLVSDGSQALVIDAQRDFDRITARAADLGVPITHVFETHVHNDYLTGGLALAAAVGAQYLMNADDPVRFARTGLADRDVIKAGRMTIEVAATPGHTFTHLSYVLRDDDEVRAVFTGGGLLNGSTGRTDLLGEEYKETLAKAQYRSAQRLAAELPGGTAVCPTHGFGSFCSATVSVGGGSTLADEMLTNPVLTRPEAQYIEELLAGLDAYPAYYAHMGPANLTGPQAADLAEPRSADPAELRRRIDAGEWVVDLRSRTAFAAGHLHGTLNFSLGQNMATYLGWLIPWGTALTLIGDTADEVAGAQRELCRIGIDKIEAAGTGGPAVWAAGSPLESFRVADFAELERRAVPTVLLDVRRQAEWDAGHIAGATHVPLHELARRLAEVPDGEVWVHCQAGYRAAVAASILAAAGHQVVAIDDDLSRAGQAGLLLAATGAGE